MKPKRNLAARVGGWSARHWKTAALGWIAFVILAFQLGGAVGTNTLQQSESGVGESGHADKVYAKSYAQEQGQMVLISGRSKSLDTESPEFRAAVDDVRSRVSNVRGVKQVEDPYAGANRNHLITHTTNAVMVPFAIPGEVTHPKVTDTSKAAEAAARAAAKDHPDLRVEPFGGATTEDAFNKIFNDDLGRATSTSLPLTLILLVLAFGTLVAAGLPVLLAVSAVLATMGLVGPVSQLAPVSDGVAHVILLIGLAVGVDYALFYLRRAREERQAGRSAAEAVDNAAATSGRAVLVSGVTVMIAMAGMYLGGVPDFASFATGTILVVAATMLASLTVLPALMSRLGTKVDRGRIPGLSHLLARAVRFGLWARIVGRVTRRPLLWGGLTTVLLVALAIPAFSMHTGTPDVDTLPSKYPVVQTFQRLQDAFPAENGTAAVVIEARDVTQPSVTAGIDRLRESVGDRADLFPDSRKAEVEISPDKKVATVSVGIAGDGQEQSSKHAVDVLRHEVIPATIGSVDGARASVNGMTAQELDFNETVKSHLPLVVGFVLAAAFVLLLVTFRSIVVPIKAIVLNLLSVGAAYGVMTLIFNQGVGKELLGFEHTGPRFHPLPRPRARRRGHEDRGRGPGRDQEHRRCRDRRRGRDGRRVRDLRDPLVHDVQADGRRARVRRAHRRDAHPGRPPARQHETARRAQLVAAQAPPLAAQDPPRRRGGPGDGLTTSPASSTEHRAAPASRRRAPLGVKSPAPARSRPNATEERQPDERERRTRRGTPRQVRLPPLAR